MSNKDLLNIVILGASFAGLAVAHKFLRKTIEEIGVTRSASRYRIVLVGPSTHLFWNIGAPRALVADKLLPLTEVFVPFLELFEEYSKTRFTFIQGKAIAVDFHEHFVTVEVGDQLSSGNINEKARWSHTTANTFEKPPTKTAGDETLKQTISYHALIIATGTSAESPLLSLHGSHDKTIKSMQSFHDRVNQASSIVVAGGGPSGIECAGQLATFLNRGKKPTPPPKSPTTPNFPPAELAAAKKSTWLLQLLSFSRPSTSASSRAHISGNINPNSRKTIILISGHDRLLPRLLPAFGDQAERKLKKLGVNVIHNTRLIKATETPSGVTRCELSDDSVLSCDLFVAATGVYPNTKFLPPSLLDASAYVNADPLYLRVGDAGDRVYAIGDCASHSKNSIQDVYDSIPILLQNLKNDLIAFELKAQHPYGGAEPRLEKLEDWAYIQNPTDSQLMPISRFGGVGILFGMKLPSFIVWVMKGRDYRIGRAKMAAGVGKDPYAVV